MVWFNNLKTTTKLLLGFALVTAIAAVVGYVGISDVAEMDQMLDRMYTRDLKGVSTVQIADMRMVETQRTLAQSMCLSCHDPHGARISTGSEIDAAERDATESAKESMDHLHALESMLETDTQKAQGAEAVKLLSEHTSATKNLFAALRAGDRTSAIAAFKQTRVISEKFNDPVERLADEKVKVAEETYKETDGDVARARLTLIGLVVGCVFLGLLIGFLIARAIASPLNQAVDVLRAVASGDLTRSLDLSTKDEVGQMATALTTAVTSMRTTLLEVQTTATSVASAAQQLSASAEQISSGAQEQASSLEETAASLEEMTSTVRQNADNAQQANQLALAAREVADQGGAASVQTVAAMADINQSSKRIADIISTIDEIAFQTNLLALNAAVEAARAGEQGRGFAVVATEVRSLAQRSASAAKEIKSLIQDSVHKVDSGSDLVNASGRTLQEIVGSVKRVTDIVGEIAAASREQSAGIDQVNKAVTQMDQVTQSNASQTEELSGTAEALAAQAQELQSLVGRFLLGQSAKPAAKAAGPAARSPRKSPPALRVAAASSRTPVVDGTAALDAEFEEF